MKVIVLVFMAYIIMPSLMAKTYLKTEVVEEQEKSEFRTFCSKSSAQGAVNLCEKWLDKQTKTLGDRLLTSSCSQGDQTTDPNCLYKATGDLKYALKKYRTETERN